MLSQMRRDERRRLLTAALISVGLYLLLFLLLRGIGPLSGGTPEPGGGSALVVQLEPIAPELSGAKAASTAASGGGAGSTGARATASPGAGSPPSAEVAQSSAERSGSAGRPAPANPFALPPGIDLSGQVVAASSGALETGQVSSQSAGSAGEGAGPSGPRESATGGSPASGLPSQPEMVIGPGYGGAFGSETGAPFGAGGVAPTAGGRSAEASSTGSTGAAGGGHSLENLNVFQQSVLAQVLGQQAAGYGGGGGVGGGSAAGAQGGPSGSAGDREGGGGGGPGASGASGGGAASGGPGGAASSGRSPYPISWSANGKRQIAYEPPPPSLSAYADVLPPRTVVRVQFEVAASGYVTPLKLVGSSGDTIVDNLLLTWMGRWRFTPVSPKIPDARGSLEYVIQANTAR